MPSSVDDLNAELKNLKKRLYIFKFRGMELQQRARSHFAAHRVAEQDPEDEERSPNVVEMKLDAFQSHPTPLSNEYILEMISGYLPLQDLRNCQKVCKLWSEEMKRCVLKRRSLILAYEDNCSDAEELLKEKRNGNVVNISNLVVLEIPLPSRIVQDIIWHFGSTMSGLKLDECKTTAQEIYGVLKSIPYLETFSVKTTSSRLRRQSDVSLLDQLTSTSFSPPLELVNLKKLTWEDVKPVRAFERLPGLCPNLVYLKIHKIGTCDPNMFHGLHWDSLQVLKLAAKDAFKKSHFRSLTMMQLKISILSLTSVLPGGGCIGMGQLSCFLNSIKDTLLQLSLTDSMSDNRSTVSPYSAFPVELPCLKILKSDVGFINSLSLVDNLPSLERFDCCTMYWVNWWTILCKSPLPLVHESVFEASLGAIDNECLQKISASFPNLRNLEMAEDRIDDWALRTICKNLPKLRSLRITKALGHKKSFTITDSGITGVPIDRCKNLLSVKDIEKKPVYALRVHPFIGDLKELRILEISSTTMSPLTDLSVLCGFSKLSNLVILSLPKSNITEQGCKSISNSMISKESGGSRRIIRANCLGAQSIPYHEILSEMDEVKTNFPFVGGGVY